MEWLKSFLQKRLCCKLKRQSYSLSCRKSAGLYFLLEMEITSQPAISVKFIPYDSVQWKENPNKQNNRYWSGCFYRHKHHMMNKPYIREKFSMHLQYCRNQGQEVTAKNYTGKRCLLLKMYKEIITLVNKTPIFTTHLN